MFPIHDENPTRTFPVLTLLIILLNAAMFFFQLSIGLEESVFRLGLIPAELLGEQVPVAAWRHLPFPPQVLRYNLDPAWLTIFTSMFMHGGWLHILSNMWFLWVFGNNIEDTLGKVRFLLFYLASGVAAALAQVFLSGPSPIPMVGASGAVAGVLGAYLSFFPHSRVHNVVFLGFFITTIVVPAWVSLGLWFALQLLHGLVALVPTAATGGVAYAAHVGGFVFGWAVAKLFGPAVRRRRVYGDYERIHWR